VVRFADLFRVRVADLVDENLKAHGEPAEAVAMFRDLKALGEDDRETIRLMIETLKKRRQKSCICRAWILMDLAHPQP
jgi:hypothetical protein